MTYVTEQTSAELRAHMRRIQKIPGWHDPLADRLFKEVEAQDAEIARLKAALERPPGHAPNTGEYSTAQMMLDEMSGGDTSQPLFD